ncbi:hypothetical protein LINPERPRIM_LOCUS20189 [Linum perenne]
MELAGWPYSMVSL